MPPPSACLKHSHKSASMYVHRRKLYETTQLVLDCLSFWPIWLISIHLRVALDPFTPRKLTVDQAPGWVPPMVLIMLLSLAVLLRLKLFVVPQQLRAWTIFSWAGEITMVIAAVTVLTTFFSHEFGAGVSRAFVLCMLPVTFAVLTAIRFAALAIISFAQRGSRMPRIAMLGDSKAAARLIARMGSQIGSTIRGVILPEGSVVSAHAGTLPVLGTTGQIAELVNRERLDRVIIINGSVPEPELARCNKVFWQMGLSVTSTLSLEGESDSAFLSGRTFSRIELSNLNGLRVLDIQSRSFDRSEDQVKRIFDLSIAVMLIVFVSPLLLLIALLVKLNSKGPVFEKAPRVGLGGRHFTCLKFRTTYEDLNQPAPIKLWDTAGSADEDDHHPTSLGVMLRRYSLDELPQLMNILKGEMSLVGPRPLPAHHLGPDGMSREFGPWSEARARVRPGLTGLWQVGGPNNLSFDDMIRLDLEYIKNRSFSLDIGIILKTPIAIIHGNRD